MHHEGRVHSLDVLRGLAVLLVLFRHLPNDNASGALQVIQSIGWTGVDLFFVLSGFLISGLLFSEFDKTGALNVKRFWLRRGLKIWPSYYFVYGAAMLIIVLATDDASLLIAQAPNYVFIQNYMDFDVRWPHSWSIAVEEHFYLILPLLLLVLIPAKLKKLPKILAVLCVAVLAFRVFLFFVRDIPWTNFYYPTHMRIDSLCFGVLLGYFHQYKRESFIKVGRRFRPLFLAAPVVLILAYLFPVEQSAVSYTIGFTVFYLMFGGLVVLALAYPDFGRSGPQKLIALAGVYSYTIYLAHSVIYASPGILTFRLFVFPYFGYTGDRILFFGFSVVLGVLISHVIERPFLRLRAKWLPSHDERGSVLEVSRPPALAPQQMSFGETGARQ